MRVLLVDGGGVVDGTGGHSSGVDVGVDGGGNHVGASGEVPFPYDATTHFKGASERMETRLSGLLLQGCYL